MKKLANLKLVNSILIHSLLPRMLAKILYLNRSTGKNLKYSAAVLHGLSNRIGVYFFVLRYPKSFLLAESSEVYTEIQVSKDQEKAQSEKDSHSKNRDGKKLN